MAPRRLGADDDADLAAARTLVCAAFAGMEGRIDPASSVHRLTAEAMIAAATQGEVWVIGATVVATVTLTRRNGALYLGKLAVAEAARGQGFARLLVNLAAARAAALGLAHLELQTRVELIENHRTFAALGFVEAGRTAHPGFAQSTSITFVRPVAPGT